MLDIFSEFFKALIAQVILKKKSGQWLKPLYLKAE